MSVAPERVNKRMKGDTVPMGTGLPPSDGYYGQHPPPPGRYPPYGGHGGPPPMGSGYPMWQQGHPPPPHSWGHGSSGPPPGSMYPPRGGPPLPQDRGNYGGPYHPRGHPHMGGGVPGPHRTGKPSATPQSHSNPKDGPTDGSVAPQQSGYSGGFYQSQQGRATYGSNPYPPGGPPPPLHHGPPHQQYGSPPPSQSIGVYGSSPSRSSQPRSRTSPEVLGGGNYGQSSTGTNPPEFENIFSPRSNQGGAAGTSVDDDGNCSVGTDGNNSKDKGRGSYKCGKCGAPKKGHVCPYQTKLSRKVGEPLPEMRSAAIQVEMDEFMTLRRLNIRIQGFPESYASEPHGEDMVVGEPHQTPPISTIPAPQSSRLQHDHGDVLNGTEKSGASTSHPSPSSHDPGVMGDGSIVGTA